MRNLFRKKRIRTRSSMRRVCPRVWCVGVCSIYCMLYCRHQMQFCSAADRPPAMYPWVPECQNVSFLFLSMQSKIFFSGVVALRTSALVAEMHGELTRTYFMCLSPVPSLRKSRVLKNCTITGGDLFSVYCSIVISLQIKRLDHS